MYSGPSQVVYYQSYKLLFRKLIAVVYVLVSSAIAYPRLLKTAEAVPGVVPYFCDTSLNSHLSWPPPILVLLLSADVLCCAIVDIALLTDCSPAVVPGAGRVARSALRLACQPPRPCPEARPRLPQSLFPVSPFSAEIDSMCIPLRPSAPQRHPAQASMSVDRHRARGFPPGHSPSPPTGVAPRPPPGYFGTLVVA